MSLPCDFSSRLSLAILSVADSERRFSVLDGVSMSLIVVSIVSRYSKDKIKEVRTFGEQHDAFNN